MITQTVTVAEKTKQNIVIGRRGTYETEQVVFDISYLIEKFGDGNATLMVKRSADVSAYPAVTTQEGNTLTWVIGNVDTSYKGHGECELFWYVNDGLAKSMIYDFTVLRDIGETTKTPPDPYQTWVDTLTELGAETLQNAQDAAQSAADAEEAAEHYPQIIDNYWYVWDVSAGEYVNTGVPASGGGGGGGSVYSVNGKIGIVVLDAEDVGALPADSDLDDIPDGETYKRATAAQLSQIATNTTAIETINGKIPQEASSNNKLADKAYVATEIANTVPSAYTSNPSDLGVASAGSSTSWSRGDHVHKMPSASDVGAYAKPSGGIPASDLASSVQTSLGKADTAYQEPSGGIPSTDMSSAVQTSLEKADTAYQKPSNGIPASDLASGVIPTVPSAYTSTPSDLGVASAGSSTSWSRGDHVHKMPSASDVGAYEKPSGGIPASDMTSAVQTSLGKADTAYQKPSGGIPASDLASGVIPTVPTASTSTPVMDGVGSAGTSTSWAKGDHVHPTDTSRAAADLGISSATANQYVQITAVDSNGKPTAFGPGTPSGGGDTLVVTITGTYTSDVSYDNIVSAISAGAIVKLHYGYGWYSLVEYNSTLNQIKFSYQNIGDLYINSYIFTISKQGNNTVVNHYQVSNPTLPDGVYKNTEIIMEGDGNNTPYFISNDGGLSFRDVLWAEADFSKGIFPTLRHFISIYDYTDTDTDFEDYRLIKGWTTNEYDSELSEYIFTGYLLFESIQNNNGTEERKFVELSGDIYDALVDATISYSVEVDGVFIVNVSGTTPSITGVANTRYICGEVSTISITPPASGIIDVIFESGSPAAVLTLPNTVLMPEWFEVEADTIYEINIADGVYGSVMAWPAT